MPKTLPIASPVSRRAALAPIALFAPEGVFLGEAPTQTLTAPTTE